MEETVTISDLFWGTVAVGFGIAIAVALIGLAVLALMYVWDRWVDV